MPPKHLALVSCSDSLDGMAINAKLAAPRRGGKAIQRREVDRIGIRNGQVPGHQLAHVLSEHGTDRMDRVVTVETFVLKARQRVDDWWQVRGELAFDHRVDSGMRRGLREINPGAPMVRLDEGDLLALVEGEPRSRIGCDIGIVSHVKRMDAV